MRMKSGKKYLVVGQTLIMYNLDPMDTDRYTCVARNFAGVKTATTTLKVHGMKLLWGNYYCGRDMKRTGVSFNKSLTQRNKESRGKKSRLLWDFLIIFYGQTLVVKIGISVRWEVSPLSLINSSCFSAAVKRSILSN